MASGNIVAPRATWWVLKDISGTHLLEGSRQLVSSLTWRKHMTQPGNMVSSETFTGLASEADCLFLSQNISGTGESESELGQHSDEFYPEEGVPTGGVLTVTCFELKINELPSCIAKDIFKALFVDDLAICFRGQSLDTHLPVEEPTKFLGLWWDSHHSFMKHISVLKTQCKEAPNLIRVVAHLKWGGDRHILHAVPCHCSF